MEYSVQDVSECRPALTSEGQGYIHISDSVEAASRELSIIDNLTEMQMAV